MSQQHLRTTCNRDCPDTCGLIATVADGRLVKLAGDPDHPITQGAICSRTAKFPARQHSPDRLTTPLLRRNGRLEPVSWEVAFDHIAGSLLRIRKESGPEAIFHYRSGGSLGLLKMLADYFFQCFGPVTGKRGDICSGAGDAAQETDFGAEDSHDFFDLRHARAILLWGKNPTVSNIHLVPELKRARDRGARIGLIDPVRQPTDKLADFTVQPRPGGDFHLAMAVARRLFERDQVAPEAARRCDGFEALRALAHAHDAAGWARAADVTPEAVESVTDTLTARPCAIQVGWGMGRRMNGSAIVRALDALSMLSGNLGVPGGGVSFYYKRRGAFDTAFVTGKHPRTLCEARLGHELLETREPPIRAVWITAGNPVCQLPDSASLVRGLESRELVVVVDAFLTDTARCATVVLPTTTLVEDDDLLGAYGHHWIGVSRPVLAPPAGVRTDLAILQELAAILAAREPATVAGLAAAMAGSPRDWKRRFLRPVAALGATVERLEQGAMRSPLAPTVMFADGRFPTATGRMQLVTDLPPEPPDEPGFPLWLFSNSSTGSQCSQWAEEPPDRLPATCHPDAAPGLQDGDAVWIESALGRIRAEIRFDDRQRRDVVIVPKGGPHHRGLCANALVAPRLTDAGEGAAYLDCRVRLVRATPDA